MCQILDVTRLPYRREVIQNDDRGTVVRFALAPGERTPPHNHSLPVHGRVLQGTPFHFSQKSGCQTLAAGQEFDVPPGEFHMMGNPGSASDDAIIEDTYPPGPVEMRTEHGLFDAAP